MVNFAANVHFRTNPDSEIRYEGFRGGYGWFLGRFADQDAFKSALEKGLRELDYQLLEFEALLIISTASDLNEGEQRELHALLDDYPLQFRTIHLYRNDDT